MNLFIFFIASTFVFVGMEENTLILDIVVEVCCEKSVPLWLRRELHQDVKDCNELLDETDPVKIKAMIQNLLDLRRLAQQEYEENFEKTKVLEENAILRYETRITKELQSRAAANFETEPPKVDQDYRKQLVAARQKAGCQTQQLFALAINETLTVVKDLENGVAKEPTGPLKFKIRNFFKKRKVVWNF